MKTLAQRLKDLRETAAGGRKLSQPDLAKLAGVGASTIAEIETGKTQNPTYDVLVKLAAYFEVNPDWLLTGEGVKHPVSSMRDEESELLLLFRALSPPGREYMLSRVRDLHADEHRQRPSPPPPGLKPDGDPDPLKPN